MPELDKTDDKTNDKTDDDGMTDGIPTDVSNALDKIFESKDDTENTDNTDDNKDDNTDDTDNKDDTDDTEKKKDDDTNDPDDKTGDDDSTDGGDKDADDITGIDVLGYDAEMVQKLNDINPNIVEDIKALLERGNVDKSSADDDSPASKKIEKVEIEGAITEEQLVTLEKDNPTVAAIVRNLNTSVEKLSTALNSVTEDESKRVKKAEEKEHYRNFCSVNKKLDGLSKDFPVLGMYDKLPVDANGVPDDRNRSVMIRTKIWGEANALYNTGIFGSFEESLEKAVVLYQGKNSENLAMRKVAKELRSREKGITSRPSKNKTKQTQPKPGSDEHKEKVISDALAKSGATA